MDKTSVDDSIKKGDFYKDTPMLNALMWSRDRGAE